MPTSIDSNTVLKSALQQVNTTKTRAVLNNADYYSFMLTMFNGTLTMASGKPGDIALGAMSKGFAATDFTAKSLGSKNVILTSAMVQTLTQTALLVKITSSANPTAAIATVGATFATKTALAFGLIGGDDKNVACFAALADLAAGGLSLTAGIALTVSGVGAGAGAVLIVSSAASTLLGGYKAHQACIAK